MASKEIAAAWRPRRSKGADLLSQNVDALHSQPQPLAQAIRAKLIGDDICITGATVVTGNAPVLAMCRRLVADGADPRTPMHVYRGDVLALKVKSIGEAARLEISPNGVGFRRRRERCAASPVRFSARHDREGAMTCCKPSVALHHFGISGDAA